MAAGGVLAAALQRRLLQAQAMAGTSWWLVITPIGWLLAGATGLLDLLPKTPGSTR